MFPLFIASFLGQEKIVKVMLQSSNTVVDVNQRNAQGINSFWIAAYNNHPAILRFLSHNGADIKLKNDIGSNALHIAVKRKCNESVKELLKLGMDIDEPKSNGVTALGIAIHNSDLSMMKLLIKGGAAVNKVSYQPTPGISPMSIAVKNKNAKAAELLLQHGSHIYYHFHSEFVDFSPIFLAMKIMDQGIIELFCDHYHREFEHYRTRLGLNPFHFAFQLNQHDLINYLSVRCSGPQLDSEDSQHLTLLMKYLTAKNLPTSFNMALRLLTRGADINYRSEAPYGRTALHHAILSRSAEAINFLLAQKEINIHLEDYSGKDCCHYAYHLPHSIVQQIENYQVFSHCQPHLRVQFKQRLNTHSVKPKHYADNISSKPVHTLLIKKIKIPEQVKRYSKQSPTFTNTDSVENQEIYGVQKKSKSQIRPLSNYFSKLPEKNIEQSAYTAITSSVQPKMAMGNTIEEDLERVQIFSPYKQSTMNNTRQITPFQMGSIKSKNESRQTTPLQTQSIKSKSQDKKSSNSWVTVNTKETRQVTPIDKQMKSMQTIKTISHRQGVIPMFDKSSMLETIASAPSYHSKRSAGVLSYVPKGPPMVATPLNFESEDLQTDNVSAQTFTNRLLPEDKYRPEKQQKDELDQQIDIALRAIEIEKRIFKAADIDIKEDYDAQNLQRKNRYEQLRDKRREFEEHAQMRLKENSRELKDILNQQSQYSKKIAERSNKLDEEIGKMSLTLQRKLTRNRSKIQELQLYGGQTESPLLKYTHVKLPDLADLVQKTIQAISEGHSRNNSKEMRIPISKTEIAPSKQKSPERLRQNQLAETLNSDLLSVQSRGNNESHKSASRAAILIQEYPPATEKRESIWKNDGILSFQEIQRVLKHNNSNTEYRIPTIAAGKSKQQLNEALTPLLDKSSRVKFKNNYTAGKEQILPMDGGDNEQLNHRKLLALNLQQEYPLQNIKTRLKNLQMLYSERKLK